jgi:hypothetical protein
MLQDLMKRGVCHCGGGDALSNAKFGLRDPHFV